MKFTSKGFGKVSPMVLAVALGSAVMVGCSDNDDDSSSSPSVQTGAFVDSPVEGINYRTATQSGATNADGEFSYLPGETVTFSIGDIELPTVTASALITPLDLTGSDNPYEEAANNIARLLQTLDADGNASNGITISQSSHTAAVNAQITDWSDTDAFETTVGTVFADETLVSANQAAQHLEDSLHTQKGHASLSLIGRFAETQELDEGMAEIVAFHKNSDSILVINANDKTVDILNAEELSSTELAAPLTASNLTRRSKLEVGTDVDADENLNGFVSGGINSVAVVNNLMAVAVEHDNKQANGVIAFYSLNEEGVATYLKSVAAGALPDNVQISSDGAYAISANEGEPSGDYQTDPEGTITVVSITNGVPADNGTQLDFKAFNEGGARADEIEGVRISGLNASVAQDIEPEYVAISDDNTKAFVSLQENNAIAVIDLESKTIERLFGLGYKDHSVAGNGLDASNKDDCSAADVEAQECDEVNDGINIKTYANLRGLYMPDSVASVEINGVNYVVTANEGDSREYFFDVENEAECTEANGLDYDEDDGCLSWVDEIRVKDLDDLNLSLNEEVFTDESIADSKNLGRLKVISTEGDTDGNGSLETLYSFGTRSFSIFNGDTGALVFDSGDDFEQITAQALGTDGFNSTNDENAFDDRSDDKGPEPEALAVGKVGEKTYAFIGLERTGGIMMYEITDPANPEFVQYTVNRDYSVDVDASLENAGDLAPEGFKFVSAEDSPTNNALLIVGNEVSGSTSVYEVK
ncbi:choice-of-anchor I family protein [Litoribrevibacter albus]|uniref:Alkaline phosphatase n=1 Tax=Litoribrevibacter albus TaxID=1473156 RepID=A0AA37S8M1_9GAMM|nr:choice-of-anchor I family protein [Litoribrevibacter albus]GLQ30320.1 alkaline phosphatase [Litoribrevibacter albus]